MKPAVYIKGMLSLLALVTVMAFLACPALAGNTVTVSGVVVAAQPPVAAFTGTPTSGYVPLTVRFTDESTSTPVSWKWEYRKGSGSWTQFSTEQDPSYTFTATGTYSIRLTATNSAGSNALIRNDYITVSTLPAPVATFTGTPTSGYAPLTVQFTDESTNTPVSWRWEYRKGWGSWMQFSTEQDPSYTFSTTGTYSIRMTATNAGGSAAVTKMNYITVTALQKPAAAFGATPKSGKTPLTVSFTDQSTNAPVSWKWEYRKDPDGWRGGSGSWTQFSTEQDPSYTFTATGTYSIRLTATNAGGSDTETKTGYITVTPTVIKPVAWFSQSQYFGTSPLTVQFTDQSRNTPTSWHWQFGDGSTSTETNPSHTYTRAGFYVIRERVSNAAGSDTTTGYIMVLNGNWWHW